MKHLLLESSAALEWLLDQPRGRDVHRLLGRAERLTASHLLSLESRRALARTPAGMAAAGLRRPGPRSPSL